MKNLPTFESFLNEGDMTRDYDGFIVLDQKNQNLYKFKYVKGTSNVKVEDAAISELMKEIKQPRANFMVHGFVRKGEWDKSPAEVLESISMESIDANDMINESAAIPSSMTDAELSTIMPDKKDLDRAEDLQWMGSSFYGNRAPYAGKTRAQLKAIKDPLKLIRRCKAFISNYGYQESVGYKGGLPVEKDRINVGIECEKALREMGFSGSQIETIRKTCS